MLRILKVLISGFILLSVCVPAVFAMTDAELDKQGNLLADFLVTGRGVVAKSLAKYKINDPEVADKGFTPEIFTAEINSRYKDATGIDIRAGVSSRSLPSKTMEYLQILLEASGKVVADNQAIINVPGLAFKGFIPATYGRMTAEIFKQKTGVQLKQTSLRFRNTYNEPDAFETGILNKMEAPGYSKGQAISQRAGKTYRVMKPIYIKKACLSCHGDPKGSIDVAGRKREGYKEGDVRGAISVKIPAG